ncbi:hypothetical protein F2Q70_00024128 [Brassica cretica]|uniref:Uncharacterized protein n=1 Tax=Brassica cretica TaxID=69181 RepID=A0A8S9GPU4_BRACR|nr:hypothetical protein F2Q70_00024128 [Brassica cretica]KAF3606129.1 hypothetical protein DY000_02051661 [Brassica cretica]
MTDTVRDMMKPSNRDAHDTKPKPNFSDNELSFLLKLIPELIQHQTLNSLSPIVTRIPSFPKSVKCLYNAIMIHEMRAQMLWIMYEVSLVEYHHQNAL